MNTSWRCLEYVFRLRLQKTSWRRLQGVLIKTNMFALALRLQKTSLRRLRNVLVKTNIFILAIRLQDVFKRFSRRLQNIFMMSSRRLTRMSSRRFRDVFKMPWRCLQHFFKTYYQVKAQQTFALMKTSWRLLSSSFSEDVFKTYEVKL